MEIVSHHIGRGGSSVSSCIGELTKRSTHMVDAGGRSWSLKLPPNKSLQSDSRVIVRALRALNVMRLQLNGRRYAAMRR